MSDPGPAPEPPDALEALRERLEATQRATERLAAETAAMRDEEEQRAPPHGWESSTAPRDAAGELQALAGLVEVLRGVLPEDIQRQVSEVLRELLLLVRALIDWWISRIERDGRGGETPVEDIPIA